MESAKYFETKHIYRHSV